MKGPWRFWHRWRSPVVASYRIDYDTLEVHANGKAVFTMKGRKVKLAPAARDLLLSTIRSREQGLYWNQTNDALRSIAGSGVLLEGPMSLGSLGMLV